MKLLLAGYVLAALLDGCADSPEHKNAPQQTQNSASYWVTCQGTIWTVTQAHSDSENISHVVIAGDDGTLFTVNLVDRIPAGAPGVRGIFAYESSNKERGLWKNFMVKRRFEGAPEWLR